MPGAPPDFGPGAAAARDRLRAERVRHLTLAALAATDVALITAITLLAGWAVTDIWLTVQAWKAALLLSVLFLVVAAYRKAYARRERADLAVTVRLAVTTMLIAVIAGTFLLFVIAPVVNRQVVTMLAAGFVTAPLLGLLRAALPPAGGPLAGTDGVLLIEAGGMPVPLEGARRIAVPVDHARALLRRPEAMIAFGTEAAGADRLIVSCPIAHRGEWALVLQSCGLPGEIVAEPLHAIAALSLHRYEGFTSVVVSSGPLSLPDRVVKRVFDLALTVPALVLLAPLMALIAAAVALDSRGPILFRQPRLGRGNRPFETLKFRTMRAAGGDAHGGRSTSRDDDRITRTGRVLRATSLDELPQLWNVLRNDMSLVGPRPHALLSRAGDKLFWEVSDVYWKRHAIKPGLTGLAQVRGQRGSTAREDDLLRRLRSDLEYLDNWSIWRDIGILMRTATVIVHPNAY